MVAEAPRRDDDNLFGSCPQDRRAQSHARRRQRLFYQQSLGGRPIPTQTAQRRLVAARLALVRRTAACAARSRRSGRRSAGKTKTAIAFQVSRSEITPSARALQPARFAS